jgi:hypothetical protein
MRRVGRKSRTANQGSSGSAWTRKTGVLVQVIELGGRSAVGNWFAIIEAVDHDMPQELFGPRPHVQS